MRLKQYLPSNISIACNDALLTYGGQARHDICAIKEAIKGKTALLGNARVHLVTCNPPTDG
jgi:hypothetical protein